jgi:seryl-tRNA synthetase
VALIKSGLGPLQQALDLTDAQLQQLLLTLPNLPAAEVPRGKHLRIMNWCVRAEINLFFPPTHRRTGIWQKIQPDRF